MSELIKFTDLNLDSNVLKAIEGLGYEVPTPIQSGSIPLVLEGHDMIAQAQTGTGKTAAFALPILSNLDLKLKNPQVIVLTPTRELSIQVAEAFQSYSKYIKGFHTVPIYGGQDYRQQLKALDRGVHVVVGTPGRVMDHMRRGSLKLDDLNCLVLDEADEMLRMGFIDDVEWVLSQIPNEHQTLLFSATMPKPIRDIANEYLKEPKEVTIKIKETTSSLINQRYCILNANDKLTAMTRILEMESTDGCIVFVRTKTQTLELKDKLMARGFAVDALNGDIAQNHREKVINKFKKATLDILIATDVAARGLDVPRTRYVINYDAPYDVESYIHRIGRTGRAGKEGDAVLFITPRERRILKQIERATKKPVVQMSLPSSEMVNEHRMQIFKERIKSKWMKNLDLSHYKKILGELMDEETIESTDLMAVLASMVQGKQGLVFDQQEIRQISDEPRDKFRDKSRDRSSRDRPSRDKSRTNGAKPSRKIVKSPMDVYQVSVGQAQNAKPGNILGAIANEGGIGREYVGEITLYDNHSTVELPKDLPSEIVSALQNTRVCGHKIKLKKSTQGQLGKDLDKLSLKPRSSSKPSSFSRKNSKDSFNKPKPRKKTPYSGKKSKA